jgi:hypothetical protein
VSGHVVFLRGDEAAHQDESLVVHVISLQIGSSADSEGAAISFVNDLETGLGTAALAIRTHCSAFVGRDHPGQHETVTPGWQAVMAPC